MNCCKTCGFFGAREHLNPDLSAQLESAGFQGACLEPSNNFLFLPLISNADHARCGKWMEHVDPALRTSPASSTLLAVKIS